MAKNSGNGKSIKIIELQEDRSMKLNTQGLESILLRKSIKNLPLVIVSVVGDFRKGKSFMLNFFLQYLQSPNNENWIHDVSQTDGFPWRKGIERETTGWLMWSEPFIRKLPNGKSVAIVLIDSQGAKDHESSVQDCVQLFALSTLVSSIQVINQKNNLQESDFDELGLFLDYGLAALKEHPKERPFQKLVFLIRDWDPSDNIDFGFDAGKILFDRKMEIKCGQTKEMLRIRKNIRSCFSPIECYLMHHPGLQMTESNEFSGLLKDMRQEFVEDVEKFVNSLLDSSNLIVKKIGGREITGKDLYDYINLYFEKFSNGDMPEVESITSLASKSSILFAKNKALNFYVSNMDELTGSRKYVSKLRSKHIKLMSEALNIFDSMTKLGSDEYIKECRGGLQQELENIFQRYNKGRSRSKKCSVKKCICCC